MKATKIGLGAIAIAAAAVGWRGTAGAHGFPGPYADNSSHTFVSIEPTESEFLYWNHFVYYTYTQYGDRTDLSTSERGWNDYTATTDVYWYTLDQWAFDMDYPGVTVHGDSLCVAPMSDNKCDQFRVRISNGAAATSEANQWQLVCHEFGHTVGFDDSIPEPGLGCMSGGGAGWLSDHEIAHINERY
ncbi:MAG TPA: hypothetical protein VK698_08505 [Kofleriaceae bacterium]|nr:hypothetical protein [Kofleriaceae bacterium]